MLPMSNQADYMELPLGLANCLVVRCCPPQVSRCALAVIVIVRVCMCGRVDGLRAKVGRHNERDHAGLGTQSTEHVR